MDALTEMKRLDFHCNKMFFRYFESNRNFYSIVICLRKRAIMEKCYMIDYHARNICSQILWIVNDERIAELIEITVRYVIDILKICYGQCYNKINVTLTNDNGNLNLNFSYITASNKNVIEEGDTENQVKLFFTYYYDNISHKFSNGENTLVFRIK